LRENKKKRRGKGGRCERKRKDGNTENKTSKNGENKGTKLL
jgi:hypothetical protein